MAGKDLSCSTISWEISWVSWCKGGGGNGGLEKLRTPNSKCRENHRGLLGNPGIPIDLHLSDYYWVGGVL